MSDRKPQALQAAHLSYEVEAKPLLDDVSLHAQQGQFVGLIGPNGAGKSTLLRALAGILRCQHGTVQLEGVDLKDLSARAVAEGLAIIPQIAPYTSGFTSLELVLMGRYPHLGLFQVEGKEDDHIARDAMRLTETEHLAERPSTICQEENGSVFLSPAL